LHNPLSNEVSIRVAAPLDYDLAVVAQGVVV